MRRRAAQCGRARSVWLRWVCRTSEVRSLTPPATEQLTLVTPEQIAVVLDRTAVSRTSWQQAELKVSPDDAAAVAQMVEIARSVESVPCTIVHHMLLCLDRLVRGGEVLGYVTDTDQSGPLT